MRLLRGLVASALLGASLAEAQALPSTERSFTLEYVAADGCPSRDEFIAAVQARTPGAAYVAEGLATLGFRVRLLEGGSSTLWVDLPDGSSRRQFDEPACTDAVDSIAVIASMVLEAAPSQRLSATEQIPDAPARVGSPEPRNVAAPPADVAAPRALSLPKRVDDPARSNGTWSLAVTAGAALESAVAPSAALAGVAGVEGAWQRPGRWAARVRAEALVSMASAYRSAVGEATFKLTAGRLSGCFARLELGNRIRAWPCATFDAGSLRARGGGAVTEAQTRYMPWLAGGAAGNVEFLVSSWLALEAMVSVRGLARSDRFIFLPESLVYEVPGWSAGLGLGFVLRFHRTPGSIASPRDIASENP